MNLCKLKTIADKDTIRLKVNDETGIVSVMFEYRGCLMSAQYSTSVSGIYAFCIADESSVIGLFELLESDRIAASLKENDDA